MSANSGDNDVQELLKLQAIDEINHHIPEKWLLSPSYAVVIICKELPYMYIISKTRESCCVTRDLYAKKDKGSNLLANQLYPIMYIYSVMS